MKITSWLNDSVLFECDSESMKVALELAVKSEADLYGADLSRAYLSGANLSGAKLYGANLYGDKITKCPIQIGAGMKWYICITEKHIQIGCQVHKAVEWFEFDDAKIASFHSEALEWWRVYKPIIKALWEEHNK